MASPAKPDDERRIFALLLLAGVALRLLWLGNAAGPIAGTFGSAEASRVALAVAQGRGIADAYYQGYGPTAHLMPVSPAIAGFLLWLFGPGSAGANLALLGWCLAQVGIAYTLLRALFRQVGADPVVTRWGSAILCLATPFAPQETIDFRYWEGALALGLGAANLLLIARLEDRNLELDWRTMMLVAGLFAITLLVCPPVAIAAGACWAVFSLRRLSLMHCIQLGSMTVAAVALVIGPWAMRNQRELGAPILLRSNFGLEFAIANHPAALSDRAPDRVFAERIAQIHPYQTDAPPFRVRPGGEVAYSRALGSQTWKWVAAHPAGFARLCLRHLSEFYFPRPWQMSFSGWGGMRAPRVIVIGLVNLLGLIGLCIGLHRRRRGYAMLAIYLAALSLPYALFEPTARYIYLAYALLAFPAVEALIWLRQLSGKRPAIARALAAGRAQLSRG
jgi:hypothetical protein